MLIDLGDACGGFLQRQGFSGNAALQRLAVKKFHGDETLRFTGRFHFKRQLTNIIDGADIGVI